MPDDERDPRWITKAQSEYIRFLLKVREGNEEAEEVRAALNIYRESGTLTKHIAGTLIQTLKEIPVEYEDCRCGHHKQQHSGAKQWGKCLLEECECRKYSIV